MGLDRSDPADPTDFIRVNCGCPCTLGNPSSLRIVNPRVVLGGPCAGLTACRRAGSLGLYPPDRSGFLSASSRIRDSAAFGPRPRGDETQCHRQSRLEEGFFRSRRVVKPSTDSRIHCTCLDPIEPLLGDRRGGAGGAAIVGPAFSRSITRDDSAAIQPA